jgi:carboxyl-terminal processing protease
MKRFGWIAVGMFVGAVLAAGLLPVAQGAVGGTPAGTDTSVYRQLDLFSEAFETVRAKYVRPVKDPELIDAAIEGMVSGLDPHSSYLNAKQFSDFQVQATGEFGGVGIEVLPEDGLVKVVSPIDDTPAAKAGIKPGDYIAAINGASIQGAPLDEAIDKMRGPAGTKITLTILRRGEKKPFDVTLTRAVIRVERVKWHREGDIGYVRLTGFNEQTAADMAKAIAALKKEIGPSLKGYVLDLRNNPGGLFDQAVTVADDFLNAGEVVSTRGRLPEETHRYSATKGDITGGKPVVVLINAGSASASEIVAGALQDHKRAVLIGMRSFGKGSVQSVIPLAQNGGALKLTTARYYTPSGRSIQAEGIVPNVAVGQGDEAALTKLEQPSEADLPGHLINEAEAAKKKTIVIMPAAGKKYEDFQLSYALDYLRGKKTLATVQKTLTE